MRREEVEVSVFSTLLQDGPAPSRYFWKIFEDILRNCVATCGTDLNSLHSVSSICQKINSLSHNSVKSDQ